MRSRQKMNALCLLALAILVAGAQSVASGLACSATEPWNVDDLCMKLGLTSAQSDGCSAITIFEAVAYAYKLKCKAESSVSGGLRTPPAHDKDGTVLPQDLPDIRSYHQGTPKNLPFMPFMKAEGATYYWYYRNLLNLANWAPCPGANSTAHLPVPQGWTLEKIINLPTPAGNPMGGFNGSLPYAALLKPAPHSYSTRRDSCRNWYSKASQARALAKQKHPLAHQQDQDAAATASTAAVAHKRQQKEAGMRTEEPVGAPVTPAQRMRQLRAAQQAPTLAQQQGAQISTAAASNSPAAGQEKQAYPQRPNFQVVRIQSDAKPAPASKEQPAEKRSSSKHYAAKLQQVADGGQDPPMDAQQATTSSDSLLDKLTYTPGQLPAPVQGQYGQGQYNKHQKQYYQAPEQYSQPQKQYYQAPEEYSQPQKQYSQAPEQYSQYQKQYNQAPEEYSQYQKQYNQAPEQYSQQYGESHNQPHPGGYQLHGSYGSVPSRKYYKAPQYPKGPEEQHTPTPEYKHTDRVYYKPAPHTYEGQEQPQQKPYQQQEPYDGGAFYLYGSGSGNKDSYLEKPYSPAGQGGAYAPELEHWRHSEATDEPKDSYNRDDPAPQYKDTDRVYYKPAPHTYEGQPQPQNPSYHHQEGYDGGAFYRYGSGGGDKDSYLDKQYNPAGQNGPYMPELDHWKQPKESEHYPEASHPNEEMMYKRPEPFHKRSQHYNAGTTPPYPQPEGPYSRQGPYPQPERHYEHPPYRPSPHEQYNTGAQEPYHPHQRPDAPHDRYPGPDSETHGSYHDYGPDAHTPYYGEAKQPYFHHGPSDVSDIPYKTVSDMPPLMPPANNSTQDDEPADSEPDYEYKRTGLMPKMPYTIYPIVPGPEYEEYEGPYTGPEPRPYPKPKEGSRYGGANRRPTYPQPDKDYERHQPNYHPNYNHQDTPYHQQQRDAEPPRHYKPDGRYSEPPRDMQYNPQYNKQYSPQYDHQYNHRGLEGPSYGPRPGGKPGPDYGSNGPEYTEPVPDDSLLDEFDIMYNWEDQRYDQHYSCGRDEGQAASPALVVLVRDSLTPAEWGLGLSYNQIPSPEEAYGPGNISAGAWYAAEAVWNGGLGDLIVEEVDEGCRSVTVAGVSFGGAVAQLLAMRIEDTIAAFDRAVDPTNKAGARPAAVTVVTFGSQNVGDREWAGHFSKKINARNIAFQGDLFTEVPCEGNMKGCSSTTVKVNTQSTGPWQYTRSAGNLVYPAAAMPFTASYVAAQSWSALTQFSGQQMCRSNFVGAATAVRTCSYLCMTAQFVDESNNMCWLDPNNTPASGSTRCNFEGGAPTIVTPVRIV